jgi:hypothetical protein
MKKKVLFTILFFIAIAFLVASSARAYTYDGEINPETFFIYEPLFVEPLSEMTALMVVGKEDAVPRYVVLCVMRVPGGLVILAYAYYDADMEFKHFMIDTEKGHYAEHPFDPTIPAEVELHNKLISILNAFYGKVNA